MQEQPTTIEATNMVASPILTVAEAARLCRVSQRTLRNAIMIGALPHYRIGVSVRVPTSALFTWLESGGKTR